ncbi:hypothetical protein FI667_g1913, partial [Globisporangium splendens]
MGMTTPTTAAARESNSRSTGWRQRWVLRALLLLGLFAFRKESLVLSSIHEVHGKTTGCRYTERMFADGHGPLRVSGRSTVTVNATIRTLQDSEVSDTITVHRLRDYFDLAVVVVSYSDVDRFKDIDEHSICARNFSDPEEGNREGMLYGEFHAIDEDTVLEVSTVFHPVNSGLQVVLMVPCWKQKSESFGYPVSTTEFTNYPMTDPLLSVDATISFRNPYGYLPALLYGLFLFKYV